MSYAVYLYKKTEPKNSIIRHQWEKRSFSGMDVYTHTLFGNVVDVEQIKKALNVKRRGIYKLKNCKINYELMPECFNRHLEDLKSNKSEWAKKKIDLLGVFDFSDLLIEI